MAALAVPRYAACKVVESELLAGEGEAAESARARQRMRTGVRDASLLSQDLAGC